jgi:hypothetical protein
MDCSQKSERVRILRGELVTIIRCGAPPNANVVAGQQQEPRTTEIFQQLTLIREECERE